MGAIVGYLLWIGGKEKLGHQGGWTYIISGFALILFGGIIDITDNFDSLNRYVIIGDTQAEALLEKVVGFLLGFCLLAVGFWRWIPLVVARWKSEEALKMAYSQLETTHKQQVETHDRVVRAERLATIGALAGTVAHDLRSPLGAISNAVYYLKRRMAAGESAQANPKIGQFLTIIEEGVQHSNRIITDLMVFAQVSTPSLLPTNLADVIEEALFAMEVRENVQVDKRFDPDLPPVLADSQQLLQLFVNLGNNAQDAMPDGGKLTITARMVDGFAELGFTDNGLGINDEDVKRVFDPLFTTKPKGTGLGLSICYQIVSQHHGSIDVVSKHGEGTTFTVSLPIAVDRSEAAEEVAG